ncbi:MAG: alcohol dehydrogenase catalytic domain-containing protein [Candidatus Eremiobacteraeota bacterium]|nr:alcohol dehydrogenase catalytic domain-containing protein [Candidatus Eremiobacteraeota bacterium]
MIERDLPRTMHAAVMYDVDDIRIEERPLPSLDDGDVLIRMAASGVCSGDLMPWYVRKKAPFVFGHEPAGTVVALGAGPAPATGDGTSLRIGDRVFAHHHAPCGACDACRAGRFVHCATWRATSLDPGGMAEYVRVPRANLTDTLVLPADVGFADASLVEPLACVVKSLRRAFPRELSDGVIWNGTLRDRTIYVIGAGVMGLMHVALGVASGATVYASDFNGERLAIARKLGARATFAPAEALDALGAASQGRLADAVICGPGTPGALAHAVEATGADGTVLMFTPIEPDERFVFDQSAAYFRDVRLVSSYSCGPRDTASALRLIADGVVSVERLEATEFPFPAVAPAYEAMRSAALVKAIVTFPFERPRDGDAERPLPLL